MKKKIKDTIAIIFTAIALVSFVILLLKVFKVI